MIPVGLYAVGGIYLVQGALRSLPDAFKLFNIGFSNSLAFVLLMLIVLVGALGVGLLVLAWLLFQGDRVARGLAYVAAAMVFGLVAFGDSATTGDKLTLVGALAAAAILALSPACRRLFTGPGSRQYGQPTSIVVARVALLVWLILLAVVALLYLLLGQFDGSYYAYCLVVGAVSFGALLMFQRLAGPDRQARAVVTVGAAIVLVLLLVARHDPGFTFVAGLTGAIPFALWIPNDARAFYGDRPLALQTTTGAGR